MILHVRPVGFETGNRITRQVGVWSALCVCKKYRMLFNTANLGASPNPSLAGAGRTRSVGLLNSNSIFRCIFENILQKIDFFLFCKETYTRANQGALQDRLSRRGLCVQRLGFFFLLIFEFLKKCYFLQRAV